MPQFGFIPVTTDATTDFEKLAFEIDVPYNGDMYIYVANESNEANLFVWFDDLLVVHQKNTMGMEVTSADDYYPFGLQITQNNYQRESAVNQNYKYNAGSEFNSDLSINIYETLFRGYDPALGRFQQIDPLTDILPSINQYQFGFNNPISFNDPDGLMPDPRRKIRREQKRREKRNKKNARKRDKNIAKKRWKEPRPWAKGIKDTRPDKINPLKIKSSNVGPGKPQVTKNIVKVTIRQIVDNIVRKRKDPIFRDKFIPSGGEISFSGQIHFHQNSTKVQYISPATKDELRALIKTLKENPEVMIEIRGNVGIDPNAVNTRSQESLLNYSTGVNGRPTNLRGLMQSRANTIKNALIGLGINPKQINALVGTVFGGKKGMTIDFKIINPKE